MRSFDSRYWNLTQAAAWVVYRSRQMVEHFQDRLAMAWAATILYPIKGVQKTSASVKERRCWETSFWLA